MTKKKIAIITGASSGFGVEFAKQIDQKFDLDEIWLIARRQEKLNSTAKLLLNAKGVVIKADLSTPEGINLIKTLLDTSQPEVKVLINNAGFGRTEKFEDSNEDYNESMIDVNVKAPVMLTKLSLSFMNTESYVINVASSAAYAPLPYFSVYAATKAFLLSFSYSLNEELKSRNISVTAVCPGPASTEFFKSLTEKKVNGFNIQDPIKIVRKAIKDSMKRKSVSIYGYEMNFLRVVSKVLPRKILAYFSGKVKLPQ
ncbi:MAG: SDR family NAD(P)-dependent oxidoreductase [Candidatus Delongbacteria bacterium]|jgi:short-subunit dehydrogenase|nr:SDR family NAD(P)-dependent oxidoreductase [Candidatus Delongbacteria bacterium]